MLPAAIFLFAPVCTYADPGDCFARGLKESASEERKKEQANGFTARGLRGNWRNPEIDDRTRAAVRLFFDKSGRTRYDIKELIRELRMQDYAVTHIATILEKFNVPNLSGGKSWGSDRVSLLLREYQRDLVHSLSGFDLGKPSEMQEFIWSLHSFGLKPADIRARARNQFRKDLSLDSITDSILKMRQLEANGESPRIRIPPPNPADLRTPGATRSEHLHVLENAGPGTGILDLNRILYGCKDQPPGLVAQFLASRNVPLEKSELWTASGVQKRTQALETRLKEITAEIRGKKPNSTDEKVELILALDDLGLSATQIAEFLNNHKIWQGARSGRWSPETVNKRISYYRAPPRDIVETDPTRLMLRKIKATGPAGARVLAMAFRFLTRRERDVLTMIYLQGMPIGEIVAKLGGPVSREHRTGLAKIPLILTPEGKLLPPDPNGLAGYRLLSAQLKYLFFTESSRFEEVMSVLTPKDRELAKMNYMDDLSWKEMAAKEGGTEQDIYRLIQPIGRKLQSKLAEMGMPGGTRDGRATETTIRMAIDEDPRTAEQAFAELGEGTTAQKVARLYYRDGRSIQQIARALKLSTVTVVQALQNGNILLLSKLKVLGLAQSRPAEVNAPYFGRSLPGKAYLTRMDFQSIGRGNPQGMELAVSQIRGELPREAARLHYVEGLSLDQVQERLGVSKRRVVGRLYNANQQLRRCCVSASGKIITGDPTTRVDTLMRELIADPGKAGVFETLVQKLDSDLLRRVARYFYHEKGEAVLRIGRAVGVSQEEGRTALERVREQLKREVFNAEDGSLNPEYSKYGIAEPASYEDLRGVLARDPRRLQDEVITLGLLGDGKVERRRRTERYAYEEFALETDMPEFTALSGKLTYRDRQRRSAQYAKAEKEYRDEVEGYMDRTEESYRNDRGWGDQLVGDLRRETLNKIDDTGWIKFLRKPPSGSPPGEPWELIGLLKVNVVRYRWVSTRLTPNGPLVERYFPIDPADPARLPTRIEVSAPQVALPEGIGEAILKLGFPRLKPSALREVRTKEGLILKVGEGEVIEPGSYLMAEGFNKESFGELATQLLRISLGPGRSGMPGQVTRTLVTYADRASRRNYGAMGFTLLQPAPVYKFELDPITGERVRAPWWLMIATPDGLQAGTVKSAGYRHWSAQEVEAWLRRLQNLILQDFEARKGIRTK